MRVKGGIGHTTRPGGGEESMPYRTPMFEGWGVSKSAFLRGSGEQRGCMGAGEVAPGDLNYVPHTEAPALSAGSETQERTKGPGDICDSAAPSPYCARALHCQ